MIISYFPEGADEAPIDASVVLNDNDWATIAKVSAAGQAENYWAVGDTNEIVLNGTVGKTTFSSLSIWAFIIGFDHNSDLEGRNTIHFQIGKSAQTNGTNLCFVDAGVSIQQTTAGYFSMNYTNDNTGGWESCKMRTVLLGSNYTPSSPLSGSLLAALPSELRAVMRSVKKYTDNTGGGSDEASYVTATTDYLWLLSEFEVYGYQDFSNSTEKNQQKQYDYYANGNSNVFYKHNAKTSNIGWWTRSVDSSNATFFCHVRAAGGTNANSANYSLGLAPAFCV